MQLLKARSYRVISFIKYESFGVFVDINERLLEQSTLDINLGFGRDTFSTPNCAYQDHVSGESELPRLWFGGFKVFPTTLGSVR